MYNTIPDSEYIRKFARHMESVWEKQRTVDDRMYALYTKEYTPDVAEPPSQAGEVGIRPLKTGFAGMMIDRDVALLAQPPGWHVNDVTHTITNQRHASDTLEPWLQAAYSRSQIGRVPDQQIRDLRLFGRGWSSVLVLPRLWSAENGEFKSLYDDYSAALERGDASDIANLMADIEEFKRDNFPLRWQHNEARSVWPQLSRERYLPEVVEIREVAVADILADYGEAALPQSDFASGAVLPVYIYTNWYWTATVIGNTDSAPMPIRWKHNLRMCPYILMEGDLFPEGSGLRWKSALYDHADMLEAQDEMLADLRHSNRRNTLTSFFIGLNPQLREAAGPEAMAHPELLIEIEPGEPIVGWSGEDPHQIPTPGVNPQILETLKYVNEYNQGIALNPVEQGRLLSGTSAVGFTTALQAAQTRLDPLTRSITDGYTVWGKLMFRSVQRLSEEFPNGPDQVYVTSEKLGAIGVGPSDVRRWENLIQPRLSRLLPVNLNSMMALAQAASTLWIPPRVILEEYLNYENPDQMIDEWEQWQLRLGLMADKQQKVLALANALEQRMPAATAQQLAAEIAQLPVAAQLAIAGGIIPPGPGAGAPAGFPPGAFQPNPIGGGTPAGGTPQAPGTEPGSPGAMAQGLSNISRMGVPQAMSQTVAQQIPPVV